MKLWSLFTSLLLLLLRNRMVHVLLKDGSSVIDQSRYLRHPCVKSFESWRRMVRRRQLRTCSSRECLSCLVVRRRL
jgi:hypothetical protein